MKISTITLSRNQGDFLQDAMDSILKQGNLFEYIVYDVGSTDQSRVLINNYIHKLTKKFVDHDLGPSDGLNVCVQETNGDLLYYLNSDDRVAEGAFEFVSRYFTENPECQILHGSVRIINADGAVIKIKPSMKFSLRGYALGYSVVYQQATFFRRAIFDKTRFNLDNKTCWDGELIVDMALAGARIHQTKKILGEFRIYSDSITGSGRLREQIRKDHARIAKKILGRELRKPEILLGITIGKFKAIQRRLFELGQDKNLN
jgi:glycosyltransferase involved in cell wall biosynthesis